MLMFTTAGVIRSTKGAKELSEGADAARLGVWATDVAHQPSNADNARAEVV